MLQMDYVRNLNCNYKRLLLEGKPEEKRYQYCILGRGEVRGLLPCSLRYIDNQAYLYYDISSKQDVSHLYSHHCIGRMWIRDFLWGMKQIQQELERFLLDVNNILWYPEHIFQDLESNVFSFLYVPYYKGEPSFMKLLEFWVEHIDYADEELVECIYRMYERAERNGEAYLQSRIYKDAECLESRTEREVVCTVPEGGYDGEETEYTHKDLPDTHNMRLTLPQDETVHVRKGLLLETGEDIQDAEEEEIKKKGVRSLLGGKRKRDKLLREKYRQSMQEAMTGHAVAEETSYTGHRYGQTVYIEKKTENAEKVHRLYSPEGRVLANMMQMPLAIGKRREGVSLVLEDMSVSRIHARITEEKGIYYLEDLNSTNGTYKNDLRLQPYEKQKLEEGDEVRCGNAAFIFR